MGVVTHEMCVGTHEMGVVTHVMGVGTHEMGVVTHVTGVGTHETGLTPGEESGHNSLYIIIYAGKYKTNTIPSRFLITKVFFVYIYHFPDFNAHMLYLYRHIYN